MLFANGFESLVNLGKQFVDEFRCRHARCVPQARPAFERMEAQPAFIAEPALVDVDIAPAHGSINLAVRCGIAGNAAAHSASRMIDAQVAAGAAAAANRICSLEKPRREP